jgi:hypothetical protein
MNVRTLDLIAREGVRMISVNDESASAFYNSGRMTRFLTSVALARGLTGKHIDPWVAKVHGKLCQTGFISVQATVSGILRINHKLFAANLQLFHAETIEVMAREGANALSVEALGPVDLWKQELHEVGAGTCPNCLDTGDVGAPCEECTTGSSYLAEEFDADSSKSEEDSSEDAEDGSENVTDSSEDVNSFNEAGDGSCPSCHVVGETGQECTVCNDGSVYLNFQAGP